MILLLAGALTAVQLLGDTPLRPPATYRIYSLDRVFHAEVNHERKRTTVYRGSVALWSVEGWFRVAALSNDGQSLVTGYDGVNLLSKGFTSEEVMLTFHHRGRLVRKVPLRELVPDLTKLRSTISHFAWGEYLGFDAQNRYRVKTVTGETIAYDAATGRRASS